MAAFSISSFDDKYFAPLFTTEREIIANLSILTGVETLPSVELIFDDDDDDDALPSDEFDVDDGESDV
jgi:hypothetical protein